MKRSDSFVWSDLLKLRPAPRARPNASEEYTPYHLGFGLKDFGARRPRFAFLSGDPQRANKIAFEHLSEVEILSEKRGLSTYLGRLPNGVDVLSCTSGMGASSLSIVVNELVQLGINQIIRVGTCGSIQPNISPGSVVVSQACLCRQGAADDVAPAEYPAAADLFLTLALLRAAQELGVVFHLGVTASVDTFYEGQERFTVSAHPFLLRRLKGQTEEFRELGIANYEMESGTLFKLGGIYGFAAASVCAVIAQLTEGENIVINTKDLAEQNAIAVALKAAELL